LFREFWMHFDDVLTRRHDSGWNVAMCRYATQYILLGIVTIQDNLRTLTNAYERLRERDMSRIISDLIL
jgi:hypothetical protein